MRPLNSDCLPRSIQELDLPGSMQFFEAQDPGVQAKIHELLLGAMAALDAELRARRITYWLDGGSLLGSIRDCRLIDWDDDIDLGIDRAQFERLRVVAPDMSLPGVTFMTPQLDPLLPGFVPASFRLDGTASLTAQVLKNPRSAPRHLGLGIDVFPFDEVPSGRFPRWVFDRVRLEYWIAETARLANASGSTRDGRLIRDRAHSRLVARLPSRAWEWTFSRAIRLGRGSGRWGFGPEMVWPCFDLPRDAIWPTQDRTLCGVSLPHPNDPHEYLRQHYGSDYMEPPAQGDRQTHSVIVGFVPELLG